MTWQLLSVRYGTAWMIYCEDVLIVVWWPSINSWRILFSRSYDNKPLVDCHLLTSYVQIVIKTVNLSSFSYLYDH